MSPCCLGSGGTRLWLCLADGDKSASSQAPSALCVCVMYVLARSDGAALLLRRPLNRGQQIRSRLPIQRFVQGGGGEGPELAGCEWRRRRGGGGAKRTTTMWWSGYRRGTLPAAPQHGSSAARRAVVAAGGCSAFVPPAGAHRHRHHDLARQAGSLAAASARPSVCWCGAVCCVLSRRVLQRLVGRPHRRRSPVQPALLAITSITHHACSVVRTYTRKRNHSIRPLPPDPSFLLLFSVLFPPSSACRRCGAIDSAAPLSLLRHGPATRQTASRAPQGLKSRSSAGAALLAV